MPKAKRKPCTLPGCGRLTYDARCDKHPRPTRRTKAGWKSHKLYGNGVTGWAVQREMFLQIHPLCIDCKKLGRDVLATVVDHIIPHRGDLTLFWDSDRNWQSMCKMHHDRKTARGE